MATKKTLEHYLREMRRIEEHREKWCEQNIRRHYKDLMTDLQEFLGVKYAQLAKDDKLTYEILHEKGMYARFLEEAEEKVNIFSPQAAQEIRTTVRLTYEKAWQGMVNAVQNYNDYAELKLNLTGLKAVTPDIIKNAVTNKYMEKALEKNHKSTIYEIKQQIGIGLSQGDRMSTMAKRLEEQVGKSYRKAVMIARTEVHRVREAGYQDSSERISQTLKNNDSEYVMTKTWKTMQDEAVRPQRRSKSKKNKKGSSIGLKSYLRGPNHVKMHGKTILVEEEFDLGDGATAKAPGQSGVAGHDINCRCRLSRDLMTRAEYEALTGKKLNNDYKIAQYETEEKILLDEKKNLETEQEKLNKRKENLESYEYKGIWKETVTPADYELKKDSIQKKKDYYENQINKYTGPAYANSPWAPDEVNKMKKYLKDLDEFEVQGKTYVKLSKQLTDIDDRLSTIDDEVKAVRLKLMKAKGIDPDKMQKEIDDIIGQISKMNQADDITKLYNIELFDNYCTGEDYLTDTYYKAHIDGKMASYKKKLDAGEPLTPFQQQSYNETNEFYKKLNNFKGSTDDFVKLCDYDLGFDFKGINYFTDKTVKADVDKAFKKYKNTPKKLLDDDEKDAYESLKKFFKEMNKLDGSETNKSELKKLQKKLKDKQDELDKIKKRFGLEDDKFSQKRKDAALWFTDKNGSAVAADKAYRSKAGEVWRKATKAQKDSAYRYTHTYSCYNEPLRGIEYGTSKFVGVGNVDMDNIGVSYKGYKKGQVKKWIDDLTDYIDMSSYDEDIWLQRGCRYSGMDKFFNVDPDDFHKLSEKEMAAKIMGTTPIEYGFMSTGTAKGRGLNTSGGVMLNIYAPKGTKMAYVEPFSNFGHGAGRAWDGITTQSSIGYEAEMLMQRNTQFRVIKVEKKMSQWFIDLEVIGQKR